MPTRREVRIVYMECWRFGHAWSEYNPQQGEWTARPAPATKYEEYCRCDRCGTTRRFQLNASGEVVARDYHRPEDYGWSGPADTKPTRADLRVMALKGGRRKR